VGALAQPASTNAIKQLGMILFMTYPFNI